MKTTIIILGLAALSFTSVNATTEFETYVLDQQESASTIVEHSQQNQLAFVNEEIAGNTGESANADNTVFDPRSVINTTYTRTVEDIIAEDKLITESKEIAFQPLSLDYTVEDRIEEDNQIIESNLSNEVYPLDFDRINRTAPSVKINNAALKNSDLKL